MVKRFVPMAGMTMIAPVRSNGIIAIRPHWRESLLLVIVGMYGAVVYFGIEAGYGLANLVLPTTFVAVLAYGCYRMAWRNVLVILTPLFLFRVSVATYCGIGALIPLFSDDRNRSMIDSFFAFTPRELLKYNLVSIGFVLAINFSVYLSTFLFSRIKARNSDTMFSIHPSSNSILFFGLSFLGFGSLLYFFIVVPIQFGLVVGVFPVVVYQMAQMMLVGLFMCLIWAMSSDRRWVGPLVLLGLIFSLFGLLTFSKLEMLMPIIMMVAAFIYQQPPSLFRVASAAALIITLLSSSQELVTYGRAVIYLTYGDIAAPATFEQRIVIVRDYFGVDHDAIEIDTATGLLRLSYVNVAAYVINDYDAGLPGKTYNNAYAVFVPRFVWPDKPILTDVGRDLNFAVSGSLGSSVSPGMGAELYWNRGWLGVFLGGLGIGFLLYLWSLYAIRVQEVGAWHLFAVVLLGMKVGTKSDGLFVIDFLGPLVLSIIGHFALSVIDRVVAVRKRV